MSCTNLFKHTRGEDTGSGNRYSLSKVKDCINFAVAKILKAGGLSPEDKAILEEVLCGYWCDVFVCLVRFMHNWAYGRY